MQLLQRLRKDCIQHGYGRKKWWAERLGVPSLTLSHWLSGRQRPNGKHAIQIQKILDGFEGEKRLQAWQECLWDSYYSGQPIPKKILSFILLETLERPTIDSRTLALMSCLVEKQGPSFEIPCFAKVKNRLGWLLEVSGRKPPFTPDESNGVQCLLPIPGKSGRLRKYLKKYQTSIGRKWKILDCPLNKMKSSLS